MNRVFARRSDQGKAWRLGVLVFGVLLAYGIELASAAVRPPAIVSKWDRFERQLESAVAYPNPLQEVSLQATFVSPSGEARVVNGFWNGKREWDIRFMPDEVGNWTYTTACSDAGNAGLHKIEGSFICSVSARSNAFSVHGPLRLAPNRHYLIHQDATPFFWMGDTAWNGALLSTPEEWEFYLATRAQQQFNVVQWVTTQWRAAPEGDLLKESAYTGHDCIQVNPQFFQRLDAKVDAVNRAGLLNAPVLLWAIDGGTNPDINPGRSLPEDQAILLARYMVARWGANHVVWILAGDGDYRKDKAERWRRIGRAVFGNVSHALVTMHPGGQQWILNEFANEDWYGLCGYQSGHGDNDATLNWMIHGPPAVDWKRDPARPFINLEPPYENHLGYQSRKPISPLTVRRAIYWSLLNAPPAGVTYGGHGVWGWDDGTKPPVDHPNTGVPLPWKTALNLPAAGQMKIVAEVFSGIDFGRLRPAPELIAVQPGRTAPRQFIAAAKSEVGDTALIYLPETRSVELRLPALPPQAVGCWINPRTGARLPAAGAINGNNLQLATPGDGDWLLLFIRPLPK
jgi:hypothetical protein